MNQQDLNQVVKEIVEDLRFVKESSGLWYKNIENKKGTRPKDFYMDDVVAPETIADGAIGIVKYDLGGDHLFTSRVCAGQRQEIPEEHRTAEYLGKLSDIYVFNTIVQWTNDKVCPGWDKNVWCLGFEDYGVQRGTGDDAVTLHLTDNKGNPYHPYCRQWNGYDDFWIQWAPQNHGGMWAWIPSIPTQVGHWYKNSFSGLVVGIAVLWFMYWYFRFSFIGKITSKVMGNAKDEGWLFSDYEPPKTRGRGRPKND